VPGVRPALPSRAVRPQLGTGGAQRLKESHLGRHGFTQYRKVGKGQYEKTVGKGPDTLEA